jgi:predicted enzyme related to lactoylglutathione lyase
MENQPILKSVNPLLPAGDNVEKSVTFYEEELGFHLIHKEGNPMRMAVVERDSVILFLVKNDYHQIAESTSIRIQVEGIEKLYQEYQDKGGKMIHPNGHLETKPWGVKEFVVLDIVGVCITFCESA